MLGLKLSQASKSAPMLVADGMEDYEYTKKSFLFIYFFSSLWLNRGCSTSQKLCCFVLLWFGTAALLPIHRFTDPGHNVRHVLTNGFY